MEEGLRAAAHSRGQRGQRRRDGGRGGRGRREGRGAGGEAVAEVAPGQRWRGDVRVLLQAGGGGVVAVGGAVVQVRRGERRHGGTELGLQHQAGREERLRVDVLLGQAGQRNTDMLTLAGPAS